MSEEFDEYEELRQRIAKKVERKGDCILWKGQTNVSGFGIISFNGKPQPAHRLIYRLTKIWSNSLPKNVYIYHYCRNKTCLNVDHMFKTMTLRRGFYDC